MIIFSKVLQSHCPSPGHPPRCQQAFPRHCLAKASGATSASAGEDCENAGEDCQDEAGSLVGLAAASPIMSGLAHSCLLSYPFAAVAANVRLHALLP
mmetsp:Transcript_80814/g.143109  ORF Transcript_80814/g.143109 Transcript_80814/m.143109 type:complete len:97 (+) Transcript_80814:53-343(+)